MRTARIALALIGLCGLAFGQSVTGTILGSSSNIAWGSGTITSACCITSFGICAGCGWSGNEIETRSPKALGPSLQEVKAASHKIPATQIPTASYMKTAAAINLKSPAMDEAELAQVIVDHGFSIYEYSSVDNYLYHQALKQGTNVRWVWKPMRDADQKSVVGQSFQTFDGMGRISNMEVYAKAIPERVLEKAECLLTELPDAILLVSDYEVVHPDPFLAVTTPRMLQAHRIFIVDQWDEPGFTDSPVVKPYEEVPQKPKEFVRTPARSRAQSIIGN